jgi:acyl-CoA synthetase (AMP-forming)/AMP-acid ligase II
MGEAIIAFVTTHDNSGRDEKQILKECMTKLELFMVPQRIVFLDEMPKSSNSKIDKKQLKKMYPGNE